MPNINIDKVQLLYHQGNNALIERIKATYLDVGQIRPIYVVDRKEHYNIFEGSATYLALKDAGAKEIMAVVGDKYDRPREVLINLILSHEEDRNLVAIAEKIKELSETYSPAKLAKYLKYDKKTIQDLIDLLEFDWSEFDKEEKPEQNNLFEML